MRGGASVLSSRFGNGQPILILKRLSRAASYTELLILVLIFLPGALSKALLSVFNICPVTLPGAFNVLLFSRIGRQKL